MLLMVKLLVERTVAREGPRCKDHVDTHTALKALRSLNACAETNADVFMQVWSSSLLFVEKYFNVDTHAHDMRS